MDRHLEQIFDVRYLKIGSMVNGGVLQIGCGGGIVHQAPPAGYTTVGTTLVGLSGPQQFSVPLQAAVRPNNKTRP
ncbi:hypothetical protein J7E81_28335 [Bacillus sp. ISL-18]|uniref:hypothetical protein n=1 Tax=Bacillus sp. ISL-18 TaxID=2819118 RepID=UPI001BECF999|nr:hypothetical protein [Bacillus sp. ISL-18]MBT2659085.1 hypothetical protein [Bacillus sp. ISL-18]